MIFFHMFIQEFSVAMFHYGSVGRIIRVFFSTKMDENCPPDHPLDVFRHGDSGWHDLSGEFASFGELPP